MVEGVGGADWSRRNRLRLDGISTWPMNTIADVHAGCRFHPRNQPAPSSVEWVCGLLPEDRPDARAPSAEVRDELAVARDLGVWLMNLRVARDVYRRGPSRVSASVPGRQNEGRKSDRRLFGRVH